MPSTAALCIACWGILRKAKTYLNYHFRQLSFEQSGRRTMQHSVSVWFCRRLMHSDHIDVSYFAAGIVAHLASSETGGGGHWPATIECTTRDEILQDLVSE